MNVNQLRTLYTYQTILTHLDAKPAIWNSIIPLAKSVFMFRTYVTALKKQLHLQPLQDSATYEENKDGYMRIMSDTAIILMLKIRSFAKATNNKVLLYAINYSETELRTGSELHIIKRCQTIYNKSKDHATDLAKYGVTEQLLTTLHHAINTVRPMITQRNAIASRKLAAMVNVPLLIEEARAELEKLDELVHTTIFDKGFIKSYTQLRNANPDVERLQAGTGNMQLI